MINQPWAPGQFVSERGDVFKPQHSPAMVHAASHATALIQRVADPTYVKPVAASVRFDDSDTTGMDSPVYIPLWIGLRAAAVGYRVVAARNKGNGFDLIDAETGFARLSNVTGRVILNFLLDREND